MALSISAMLTVIVGVLITYLLMLPPHYQCDKCKCKWTAKFKGDTYCYVCRKEGKRISKKEFLSK